MPVQGAKVCYSLSESCQPISHQCLHVMQVKLSTKSFGRDAAEVASEAIANVSKSLVDADMSDVIAGRPEAEALDALRIMSNALSRLQLRQVTAKSHTSFVVLACAYCESWLEALAGPSYRFVSRPLKGVPATIYQRACC